MEGKLAEHPLAELIREVTVTGLTGALRLARERVKVAIYFESGKLVFAISNLRTHRLAEVAKRNGLAAAHLAQFPTKATDEELAVAMIKTRALNPETLASIRATQVSDVLRLALLWVDGTWKFEQRVRLADETRVEIDANRLLLECARHLPATLVAARLESANGTYSKVDQGSTTNLLPAELVVLARVAGSMTLRELTAGGEGRPEDGYRAIYALSLSGLLQRSDWPRALGAPATVAIKAPRHIPSKRTENTVEDDELAAVDDLFARLENAKDHYGVLDLAPLATIDEIKSAYHALARRFHPDRFHQSDSQLRNKVESAFARIARAYETLSEQSLRSDYDAQRSAKPAPTARQKPAVPSQDLTGAKPLAPTTDASRAETSFQHGLAALKRNQYDEGIRFLAEAAMLSPREARYRAHYGHALIRHSHTRRIAETELQAALSLEPENPSYRVMLAELYKQLGLQRRAEGELKRALVGDPANQAARALLLSLGSRNSKS